MAICALFSTSPLFICTSGSRSKQFIGNRRVTSPSAALNSSLPSSSSSPESAPRESVVSSKNPSKPFVESSRPSESGFNYALANPNGNPAVVRFVRSTESMIERAIFDFRFLALFAVAGSLAGSLLCFLNGCIYIVDAYRVYWSSCVKGVHSGQMVLRLVEAIGETLDATRTYLYFFVYFEWGSLASFEIDTLFDADVYLAGTVMLIFGMGLYGLFISNVPHDVHPSDDRALKGSSFFGMFALKERPKWMKISSLDELKTKVGHVIVMILLVKMFERSKMVTIATGMDLLSYSVCIFLSSASLYILHNLHKQE
ncbi:unnamed protein product [Linum tenue]|uniref:Uncharacterized protein n=1 Tax=Linum tenue TaxID=586396 RepID=A0AAV0J3W7_9ROSI|nr:unnamed protein product [Linum tenue]